jgi:hypothetical protein
VKTLLFALGTFALVGCSGFHMVGPFAKNPTLADQSKALPGAAPAPAAPPPPLRPTPPSMFVTPADVSSDDPYAAAAKLTNELNADSKPVPNAPVTAEVSRYKGGVKQP